MRRNGNIAVNKVYNPKNKKPDMPLDADEVDSAMERFLRKKYQEKSLADGKPEPPRRDDISPTTYSSRPPLEEPDSPPPPPVPSKKGKIFGFGLRASSSSYPFSKSDKKKRAQEPRVDSAFPIPTRGYDSRMDDARYEMTDSELQNNLTSLRDMGFTETDRNTNLLRRLNGNVEQVVETLIRQGPRENGNVSSRQKTRTTQAQESTRASRLTEPSSDPFAVLDNRPTVGLSLAKPQEPSTPTSITTFGSNNPYAPPERASTGLEQSFQSLQVSHQPQQALFPHSTGGYPAQPQPIQDPRLQYSMTPPVLPTQFQGFVASPPALPVPNNPFFQQLSLSAQSTGSNPFLPQQSQMAALPSSNPFFNQGFPQQPQMPQRQVSMPAMLDHFGIPPTQAAAHQQLSQQPQMQTQDLFGTVPQQITQQANNPFQQQQQIQPQFASRQAPSQVPNLQSAQPHIQTPEQPQQQQMPQFQQQQVYQQQPLQQFSQPQQQQQQQQFSQPLLAQQTGRFDKSSILALYNFPQRLASIPEPASEQQQLQQLQQQQYQQQISPAPSDVFGNRSSPKRSATLPVNLSTMHSAGGSGNRNPFITNNTAMGSNGTATLNPFGGGTSPFASPAPQPQSQTQAFPYQTQIQQQATPQQIQSNPFGQVQEIGQGFIAGGGMPGSSVSYNAGQIASVQQRPLQQGPGMGMGMPSTQFSGIRHASNESMAVNNLDGGRHSPDAFASLSARY